MNIFETYAKIELDVKDLMRNLNVAKSKFSTVSSGIKNGVSKIAKVSAVGFGASATAIGSFVKQSVDAYGEYEQLVGGIETLFKKSSDTMLKYSQNAYKTAGMSANEYMSLATSFSASLLQGLKGDTKKAAQYTDLAIRDMSDNANKMGTDIEMIKNACQGFSKQNFMMLDNLKLGYGGSASEMARLLNDSGVLGKTFKATAKNVKDIPFDKYIEGIHKVQENLKITGTTSKEADHTIEGSFNSMKASFENLKVAFAGGGKGVGTALKEFSKSVVTYGKNLLPVVKEVFSNLGKNMGGILNVIFKDILPVLGDTLADLFKTSAKSIMKAAPMIFDNVKKLFEKIQENLPELIGVLSSIFEKVASAIPNLMITIFDYIKNGFDLMLEYAPEIAEKVYQAFSTIFQTAFTCLSENGEGILTSLISFVSTIFEKIGEQAPTFIPKVVDFLSNILINGINFLTENAPTFITSILTAISGILNGVINSLPSLLQKITTQLPILVQNIATGLAETLPHLVDNVISIFENLVDKLPPMIEEFLTNLPSMLDGIGAAIEKLLPVVMDGATKLVNALIKASPKLTILLLKLPPMIMMALGKSFLKLGGRFIAIGKIYISKTIEGAKSMFESVKKYFSTLWDKIIKFFHIDDMLEIGKDIVRGLWKGIQSMVKWLTDKVGGFADGIVGKMKKTLGIHSPSKVFAEIGKFMAEGLGIGWSKSYDKVQKIINDGLNFTANLDGNVENASGINTIKDSIIQLNDENYTRLLEALESTTIVLDNKEVGRAVRRYA